MDAEQDLARLIAAEVVDPALGEDPLVAPYLRFFGERYGDKLAAVIFYGSCLSEATRSPTSTPDFFVVTTDGAIPGHSCLTRALHPLVPPASQSAARPGGGGIFKYVYLDMAQLEATCGEEMKDLFTAGRLSKRVKLVWCLDEETRQRICRALMGAVLGLVPLVCAELPGSFTLAEYRQAAVGISYKSEFRIETPGKVEALIRSAPAYYEALCRGALAVAAARGWVGMAGEERYRCQLEAARLEAARELLRRSRRRGLARWPKVLLTMEHWGEVVLQKVERANPGLAFPAAHRRHPFVFALPYLVVFLSRGYISSRPS